MIEDVDTYARGDQGSRSQALLHARGEAQIFVDYRLAFMKLGIRASKPFLGLYLLRDISEGNYSKLFTRIFEGPVTDDDRCPPSALSRQKKLIAVVPITERALNLFGDKLPFLRRIEIRRVTTNQFLRRSANHFNKTGVCKENARTIISDDNPLVEHFQCGPHAGK